MIRFFGVVFLLAAGIPLLNGCSPQLKDIQLMNKDKPCVQCQAIVAENKCDSNQHNSSFGCGKPLITYFWAAGPCAGATITCPPGTYTKLQNTMVVAKTQPDQIPSASNETAESNSTISAIPSFVPISGIQTQTATVTITCNANSKWETLSDEELADPLQIQCAHNPHDEIIKLLARV